MEMKKANRQQFRIRGAATTRLETFVDAAFAFSITMLVISVGSIPKNYPELTLAIKKVPAFAASFAGITWFWLGHRKWSRWYGLEDNRSIILTLTLIFVMLIYVYPLRLIFSAMFSWFSGGWLPSEFILSQQFELTDLFIFYGLGFFILCGTIALLYKHAFALKDQLELNDFERVKTQSEIAFWLVSASTGLASALFALLMPLRIGIFAGFMYSTLAFTMPFVSIYFARKINRLDSV